MPKHAPFKWRRWGFPSQNSLAQKRISTVLTKFCACNWTTHWIFRKNKHWLISPTDWPRWLKKQLRDQVSSNFIVRATPTRYWYMLKAHAVLSKSRENPTMHIWWVQTPLLKTSTIFNKHVQHQHEVLPADETLYNSYKKIHNQSPRYQLFVGRDVCELYISMHKLRKHLRKKHELFQNNPGLLPYKTSRYSWIWSLVRVK